jgi:hypothetical protein
MWWSMQEVSAARAELRERQEALAADEAQATRELAAAAHRLQVQRTTHTPTASAASLAVAGFRTAADGAFHDAICHVQEAQAAEAAAVLARRAADEQAASAAEQETRIAAARSELAAAQQRLHQQQSQLEVRWAHASVRLSIRSSVVAIPLQQGAAVAF